MNTPTQDHSVNLGLQTPARMSLRSKLKGWVFVVVLALCQRQSITTIDIMWGTCNQLCKRSCALLCALFVIEMLHVDWDVICRTTRSLVACLPALLCSLFSQQARRKAQSKRRHELVDSYSRDGVLAVSSTIFTNNHSLVCLDQGLSTQLPVSLACPSIPHFCQSESHS